MSYTPRYDWSEEIILDSPRDLIRFSQSFNLPVSRTKCWEWKRLEGEIKHKGLDKNGYPRFFMRDMNSEGKMVMRTMRAARVAYTIKTKEAPPEASTGMGVLHTCDNKLCVNPNHLYLGDKLQNAKDRAERVGYATCVRGEAHGSSKLTEQNVKDIIELTKQGIISKDIIKQLDLKVSRACISTIVNGKNWKNIGVETISPTQLRVSKHEKILELHAKGYSHKEISALVGYCKEYIYDIIKGY